MFVFIFCSLRSSSSKLAQLTLEQMLEHLDSLRLNLSNTKNNCEFLSVMFLKISTAWLSSLLFILVDVKIAEVLCWCFSFFPDAHIASPAACTGQL